MTGSSRIYTTKMFTGTCLYWYTSDRQERLDDDCE